MQKYHFSINKNKFYQELDNTTNISIIGNGNTVPFTNTGFFIQEQQAVTFPSIDVYNILGKNNEKTFEELPTISHKDNNGKTSFLDSYKIIGLQSSGLVALVPMDKTKPIYIMPYQEAAYIFKNQKLPDNFS